MTVSEYINQEVIRIWDIYFSSIKDEEKTQNINENKDKIIENILDVN
jgi:hypothetical protein